MKGGWGLRHEESILKEEGEDECGGRVTSVCSVTVKPIALQAKQHLRKHDKDPDEGCESQYADTGSRRQRWMEGEVAV